MDSNHRSPVKDQLVETVLFDFPAEARKRTIGGRRSQPRDLGGDLRRDHNLRDDNDRLGWGGRQAQNGGSPDGGPMVRILLPPSEESSANLGGLVSDSWMPAHATVRGTKSAKPAAPRPRRRGRRRRRRRYRPGRFRRTCRVPPGARDCRGSCAFPLAIKRKCPSKAAERSSDAGSDFSRRLGQN
jgi:hypothetical protein